jgi:hypothetical protein
LSFVLKIISDVQIMFDSDDEDEDLPPAKKARQAEPPVAIKIESNSLDVKRELLDDSSRRDKGSAQGEASTLTIGASAGGSTVSRIIAFVLTLTSRMLWQLWSEQTRA